MIYLLTYNESYIKNLTGALLLSTLLNIGTVTAQDKLSRSKAEMCVMDVNKATNVVIELNVNGYSEYQIINNYTSMSKSMDKKFLFSSSTDIKFETALTLANKDVDTKLKLLHKSKGIQHILRYNEVNTWTVVIITEIINPEDKTLYVGEH